MNVCPECNYAYVHRKNKRARIVTGSKVVGDVKVEVNNAGGYICKECGWDSTKQVKKEKKRRWFGL